LELSQFKNIRDKAYSCCSVELRNIDNLRALNIMTEENKIKFSELEVNYNEYKKFYDYSKSNYQRLYRNKITDYFQTKTIEDFNNMKDYWNFNAAHISLKSDKTSSNSPQSLVINGLEVNDKRIMANEFNSFFTNLSSCSNESDTDCLNYVEDTFDKFDTDSEKYLYNNFKLLKTEKNLKVSTFAFKNINLKQLKTSLNEISQKSFSGVSLIPTKILKASINSIGPILVHLFNSCISLNKIPDAFKHAECIPLHKNGSMVDVNNYRGISILPPITKLFEKLIAQQIRSYFENNKLFFVGQHGFRKHFSCELALHELLSDFQFYSLLIIVKHLI
jgi:hypothetical protein